MKKPLVSIISPCYNGEAYLGRYLESLLNQTYDNIEFVFVNDGSKDKTEEIFNSYKKRLEEKFTTLIYEYQENKGVAEAINTALKYVSGEYITWPDSDDILYKDCIEKKVEYLLENPECHGVITKANKVLESDVEKVVGQLSVPHDLPYENLFERLVFVKDVYFAPAGYMLRADNLFSVLKNRTIYNSPAGQGWQMLLPFAYKYKFGFIDEPMFSYVVRECSHSRKEKDYEDNVRKTYIHNDCIDNTIKSIDMPEKEKEDLYSKIETEYIRKRMNIAIKFVKKDDANKYFEQLKEKGAACKMDIIKYRSFNNRGYKLYYWLNNKIKSMLKRIFNNAIS